MTAKQHSTSDPGYSIGVVSRLTGIHPETLRMWERRYGVVKPGRSEGKSRRYSDDDVRRLSLVKTLVDAGHQISTIATLSMAQLQRRLDAASQQALRTAGGDGPCRVILIGAALQAKISAARSEVPELEVVAAFDNDEDLTDQDSLPEADVLVVEYATVQSETVGDLRRLMSRCGIRKAVITCRFGARQTLHDLESVGVTCLRAPASVTEIQSACMTAHKTIGSASLPATVAEIAPIPPQLFSPQQLARISARTPSIVCECPHHLVDLISSLAAFETYSVECQNKNAEDAQIHVFLHATAAQARALMEGALRRVAEFEGIDLT
ncbi:MAG: MerR family transcriptional regulator [Burkholderiales bacterium]|nr:MerR family transcriptional regulator [Burkholderiales bacterium]